MANTKISNLTEATLPLGGDLFPLVQTPTGTPVTKYVKGYHLVEMGEQNYKIVVTISSNNITVALKNLAGNDFSATDPLVVKIGDSWRTLSAALSVTVNAAANTFNAGAAELAAKTIDYFVYLGWRAASSAIVIGFSRIPWGNVYSDFSGTATAGTYGAFSTAPASTDNVVNIGRIRATLSAGAGYTWTSISQSAPTTENTVQRPIFETSFLDWTPAHSRTGGAYTNLPATSSAKYKIEGRKIIWEIVYQQNATPGSSGNQTYTLPFTVANLSLSFGYNANSNVLNQPIVVTNTALATLTNYAGAAECTASNFYVSGGLGRV